MKIFLAKMFAAAVLCGFCLAQDAPPAPDISSPQEQQSPATAQPVQPSPAPATKQLIAPGSVIPVELTKTIDAKKAKTGDAVEARVTQDLKNVSGGVIVPKDTKVMGHVTDAQARTKEQKESQVGIAFDHAVMNGSEVPVPLSIQAIIAPSSLNGESNSRGAEAAAGRPATTPRAGGMASGNSGRPSNAGSGSASGSPSSSSTAGDELPSGAPSANAHEPITQKTEGVVGISNLNLAKAPTQGSIVSSEKNNVKLESGTLILLKVNQ